MLGTSYRILLLLGLLCHAAWACSDTQTIQVGAVPARVELAISDAERQTGLMHRQHLPANQGMLFVFPRTVFQQMWMRNTLIPLDVGFFDQHGLLINVITMQPDDGEQLHASARPARFALEMNAGWFARHGLLPGARLKLPDGLPAD